MASASTTGLIEAPTRRRTSVRRAKWREAATAYLFTTPVLLAFAVFMFLPSALIFYYALLEKPTFGPSTFIGLDNFRELFYDTTFQRSLINTVGYAAIMVPATLSLGLAVALLLNRKMLGRNVFRTAYFFPVVVSALAGGVAAGWIFDERLGIANKVLGYVGLGPYPWASNATYAIITIIIVALWQGVGFAMIIYLAALQTVPREYYDASRVDGASQFNQLRFVTLPAVRPATAFLAVLTVIHSFQVFDIVFVLTGGGPGNTTTTVGLYSYQTAFETRRQGYGSAIAVLLLLMILVATLAQWWFTRPAKRKAP